MPLVRFAELAIWKERNLADQQLMKASHKLVPRIVTSVGTLQEVTIEKGDGDKCIAKQ